MCPICWTTTLATFSVLVIVSAIATVATDKWSLLGIAGLTALVLLHRADMIQAEWGLFAALIAVAGSRVAWLMVRQPQELIVVRLWHQSLALAKRRCPRQREID